MSNDDHSDDDEDQIHRVDTVPPPDGERDAYSAATKVGPMAEAVVMEMMHAATVKAAELRARSDKKSETAASEARAASDSAKPAPPSAPPRPSAPRPAALPARVDARAEVADEATDADAAIPRTYAEEDEDNAETMLSPMAKPPSIPQGPHVPRAPMQTLPLAPPLARPVTAPVPLTPPLFPSQRSAPASGAAPAAGTGTAAMPPVAPSPFPAPPWERSPLQAPKAPLLGPRSLVVLAVCGSIFVIGLIMFLVSR